MKWINLESIRQSEVSQKEKDKYRILTHVCGIQRASRLVLVVKNVPANAGDVRDAASVPKLERSPGGGHGNPLQYSCLENPTDKRAWQATYSIWDHTESDMTEAT